jgi:very-short-patch-repair endonuclease
MGGKVVRIRPIRDLRTHFPAAIVVSMGPIFRAEKIRREVRFGAHFVDFANDINRIIEVDGAQWHMDVVADFDREIRIKEHTRKYAVPGQEARFLRLKAYQIINNPATTRARVRKFLLD